MSQTVRLPRLEAAGHVAFHRVLLSEWTKLRSVRSTAWSLAVGFLLTIAFPVIVLAGYCAAAIVVAAVLLVRRDV